VPTGSGKETTDRRRLECGIQRQWKLQLNSHVVAHSKPNASAPERPRRRHPTKRTNICRVHKDIHSFTEYTKSYAHRGFFVIVQSSKGYVHRLARCLPRLATSYLVKSSSPSSWPCAPARWARSIQRSRTGFLAHPDRRQATKAIHRGRRL
jgi:hypothetical protein